MKRILIGSNIYTHALKGDPEGIADLQQAKEIVICSITIDEWLSGFKAGIKEKKTLRNWRVFGCAARSDLWHR